MWKKINKTNVEKSVKIVKNVVQIIKSEDAQYSKSYFTRQILPIISVTVNMELYLHFSIASIDFPVLISFSLSIRFRCYTMF